MATAITHEYSDTATLSIPSFGYYLPCCHSPQVAVSEGLPSEILTFEDIPLAFIL